jgi:universal stress protein A
MSEYKRILLCLDLTEDSGRIADRAMDIAHRNSASVTLLHVVEYVPVEPMGEALLPSVQIERELLERARLRMDQIAERLGLGQSERLVLAGNIKTEVVRIARERSIDLIVLGSRERHGMSILFNFTEDSVMHAAPCDVLAVRLARAS